MIELSPDVAASLGVSPKDYPVVIFFGALGLWAADLFMAVNELKAMKEEQQKANAKPKEPAATPPAKDAAGK